MNNNFLNANQKIAVEMPLGPTMVIAGPGSGKTFVITERIAHMVNHLNCQAQEILVITFTKAAAEEMKTRFISKFNLHHIHFGTFHSVFYKMIRMYDSERFDLENLLSEDKKRKLIEQIYNKIDDEKYEDFLENFLAEHTLMKNQLIQIKYYQPTGISKEIFEKVAVEYEMYKERHHLFDFDDMLTECYHLLVNEPSVLKYFQNKYKYILIDEFQDINSVQFEVIKLLASKHKNLFVVGDDDQSIYQFRGSKPEFLLSFKDYFAPITSVILNVNYRSTQNILGYSNKLIQHNKNRHAKEMETYNEKGDKPKLLACKDSKEQAQHIVQTITTLSKQGTNLSECAIIYRTNIQARPIIETLLAAHLPFILKDSMITLYDQWITKDILRYLHLVRDRNNPEAIKQIINRPSRYINKIALEQATKLEGDLLNNLIRIDTITPWQKDNIQQFIFQLQALKNKPLKEAITYIRKQIGYDKYIQEYAAYRKVPIAPLQDVLSEIEESAQSYENVEDWEEALKFLANSLKQNHKKSQQEAVVLSTMHSAKGLEFEHVFIIDAVEGVIPHNKANSEVQVEEERRLFYVGLTRAKKNLYIYIPKVRYQEKVQISPFIEEMLMEIQHLQVGDLVQHKKYGVGKILGIHESQARIEFEDASIRGIDYKYCIKNQLMIKKEENKNG